MECPDEHGEENGDYWQRQMNEAAERCGMKTPRVVSVGSPFRFITGPILQYVLEAERRVSGPYRWRGWFRSWWHRWYQYLLHNHRSTALKAMLLLQGKRRIVVINVPWYLR